MSTYPEQVECTCLDATFDTLWNVSKSQIPGRLFYAMKELLAKPLLRIFFNYNVVLGVSSMMESVLS